VARSLPRWYGWCPAHAGCRARPVLSTRSASLSSRSCTVTESVAGRWPEPEEMSVPRLRSLEAIVYLALRREQDKQVSAPTAAEALHPEKVKEGAKRPTRPLLPK